MSGSDIVLLVVLCVAFAVAVGIIVYNKVKGKSCCGDCNSCISSGKAKKESKTACDGHCAHCCSSCMQYTAAAGDKESNLCIKSIDNK